VLPVCRELGIGFVPFSPIGRGFFAGAVRDAAAIPAGDVRRSLPRFQGGNLEHNLTVLERFEGLARAKGCTAPQLALAWMLAKGGDIVPIPGTKRRRYLEDNAAAGALRLGAAEVSEIEALFPVGGAAGTRYPAESMRLLDGNP
jgi:aryl-alcohol dehydrogenase-like predicted oxidoreductase